MSKAVYDRTFVISQRYMYDILRSVFGSYSRMLTMPNIYYQNELEKNGGRGRNGREEKSDVTYKVRVRTTEYILEHKINKSGHCV